MIFMSVHKFYYQDFEGNAFTHNGSVMLCAKKKKDYIVGGKEHWHDYYEIEYYYRGEGDVIFNGRPFPIERGLISFLAPTDFHYIRTDKTVDLVCISINPEFLSSKYISKLLSNRNKIYRVPDPEKTEMLIERLLSEYNSPTPFSEDIIRALLTILFADALVKDAAPEKDENYPFIHSAVTYITQHYTEDISLDSVSKLFKLSTGHFSRLFKKATGQTFKEYVTNLRLGMVRNLLENSDLPITEIAYDSGYSSLSHMSKVFKAAFNVSPAAYRKLKKS